jgi:hypothetical protein
VYYLSPNLISWCIFEFQSKVEIDDKIYVWKISKVECCMVTQRYIRTVLIFIRSTFSQNTDADARKYEIARNIISMLRRQSFFSRKNNGIAILEANSFGGNSDSIRLTIESPFGLIT